jgi:hypothetical protein
MRVSPRNLEPVTEFRGSERQPPLQGDGTPHVRVGCMGRAVASSV